MSKNNDDKEPDQTIKVDNTIVKVKTPPPGRARSEYVCQEFNKSFPSELDLTEHKKIDHAKKASIGA